MTATEFDRLTDAEIGALPEPLRIIVHCALEMKGNVNPLSLENRNAYLIH